jgi:hypothetical protein
MAFNINSSEAKVISTFMNRNECLKARPVLNNTPISIFQMCKELQTSIDVWKAFKH